MRFGLDVRETSRYNEIKESRKHSINTHEKEEQRGRFGETTETLIEIDKGQESVL